MAHQWLLFANQSFSETQRALMMKTVNLYLWFSSNSIKSLIVLIKANDGHDEAILLEWIVSFSKVV